MNLEYGIRAVPSEGARSRGTSQLLTKDNYYVWAGRVRGILTINKLWVTEDDECPPRPRRLAQDKFQTAEEIEDRKNAGDAYDEYVEKSNRAAVTISEYISVLQSIFSVMHDPVQLWEKLEKNFVRKSEAGRSNAQRDLLTFEHQENESAEEKICRFERVVEICE